MPETPKKNLFESERIKVKCPQCRTRLCDRFFDPKQKGWALKFRTGKWRAIISNWFVMTCPYCGTSHRIVADKGIIESVGPTDANTGIQAKTGNTANGTE
jgi:Zn finger protein HypA/HybF involved in hydrogenase expression